MDFVRMPLITWMPSQAGQTMGTKIHCYPHPNHTKHQHTSQWTHQSILPWACDMYKMWANCQSRLGAKGHIAPPPIVQPDGWALHADYGKTSWGTWHHTVMESRSSTRQRSLALVMANSGTWGASTSSQNHTHYGKWSNAYSHSTQHQMTSKALQTVASQSLVPHSSWSQSHSVEEAQLNLVHIHPPGDWTPGNWTAIYSSQMCHSVATSHSHHRKWVPTG